MTIREFDLNVTTETSTTPTAGTPAEAGDLITKAYFDANAGGSGSGVGGINYIEGFGFEEDEDGVLPVGWAVYGDAAATTPVDGTGGSPSVTFLAEDTTPLVNTLSADIVKDAVNRQGEGISYDFTIDKQFSDNPAVMKVQFYYSATANLAFGDPFDPVTTPGDIYVGVYDVDGAELIELDNFILDASGQFTGYFQNNAGNDDYRLIIHIGSTNASAYTLKIDDVQIGPGSKTYGPIITEWKEFTPQINALTTQSEAGKWRRVGDSMEVILSADPNGAATGNITITIPDGKSIDTSKIPSTSSTNNSFGFAQARPVNGATAGMYVGAITYGSVNSVQIYSTDSSTYPGGANVWNATKPATWAASGDSFAAHFTVPIQGWGGVSQLSGDSAGRVVAARSEAGTETIVSGSHVFIQFNNSTNFDTHNAFSHAATGTSAETSGTKWTAPVSGYYAIDANVLYDSSAWNEGDKIELRIYKNSTGSFVFYSIGDTKEVQNAGTFEINLQNSDIVYLNAGEAVKISTNHAYGSSKTIKLYRNFLSIHKIQGPVSIAPGEVVAARVNTLSTASNLTDNTEYYLNYSSEDHDTHGSMTSGGSTTTTTYNGSVFTAPAAGYYFYTATAFVGGGNWANGDIAYMFSYAEGVSKAQERVNIHDTHTQYYQLKVTDTVKMGAGDRIQISVRVNNTDGTQDIANQGNTFSVHRVGGAY